MSRKTDNPKTMPMHNTDMQEAFTYYRKKAKHRNKKNTIRATYHRTVMTAFWKKVEKKMLEHKGGVVVDNFGYFCIGMTPVKTFVNKKRAKGRHTNPHTKSRTYFPLFIPNLKNKTMKVFTMDRSFSRQNIRVPLSERLLSGQKYLNYFEEVYKTFFNKYRKSSNR